MSTTVEGAPPGLVPEAPPKYFQERGRETCAFAFSVIMVSLANAEIVPLTANLFIPVAFGTGALGMLVGRPVGRHAQASPWPRTAAVVANQHDAARDHPWYPGLRRTRLGHPSWCSSRGLASQVEQDRRDEQDQPHRSVGRRVRGDQKPR